MPIYQDPPVYPEFIDEPPGMVLVPLAWAEGRLGWPLVVASSAPADADCTCPVECIRDHEHE